MPLDLRPPELVRDMKCLMRAAFDRKLCVSGLRVEAKHCSILLRQLNKCLLNQPRLKNIVPDTDGNSKKKIILLNSEVKLNEEQETCIKNCGCEQLTYEMTVDYNYWSCDQVLRAVLPRDIGEITTAFETVGHIAHMNLRDSHLDYKKLIGQVILDKNSPQIKTVVNKVNTIDETYRFFHMELLAGQDEMMTTVKEHGCLFSFDFSKVYWNSRLQSEHKRLVDMFSKSDVICDMFAGVGPFAIPAAKKGCIVYANDLNPESFASLKNNCKLNHIEKNVHCFNMDARDFVTHLVKDRMLKVDQIIMNLPATAVDFLDVFKGLYSIRSSVEKHLRPSYPTIHCYCFSKAENPVLDAQQQIEAALRLTRLKCQVFSVRNVAPKKMMMCVSFTLPREVAVGKNNMVSKATKRDDCDTDPGADESLKRAKLTQD